MNIEPTGTVFRARFLQLAALAAFLPALLLAEPEHENTHPLTNHLSNYETNVLPSGAAAMVNQVLIYESQLQKKMQAAENMFMEVREIMAKKLAIQAQAAALRERWMQSGRSRLSVSVVD